MRREGFEFGVAPPKAVMIPDPEKPGRFLEPVEECTILVKEKYAGKVVEKLTMRKGEMKTYETMEIAGSGEEGGSSESDVGWIRIEMDIPARGLIGYVGGEFKNDVHGEGWA
jgi:GTP-binding protein